jgi:hypothetical protein
LFWVVIASEHHRLIMTNDLESWFLSFVSRFCEISIKCWDFPHGHESAISDMDYHRYVPLFISSAPRWINIWFLGNSYLIRRIKGQHGRQISIECSFAASGDFLKSRVCSDTFWEHDWKKHFQWSNKLDFPSLDRFSKRIVVREIWSWAERLDRRISGNIMRISWKSLATSVEIRWRLLYWHDHKIYPGKCLNRKRAPCQSISRNGYRSVF